MRLRERPAALLIDLDGVLRVFDPEWAGFVERKYGLPVGSLDAIAFDWGRLLPAISGQVSHAEWMAGVVSALDHAQAAPAVAEWSGAIGRIDPDVLDFVRSVRAEGIPVALTTNATDRLRDDLSTLGVADEFDVIVNSSEVGVHKPAKEYFTFACAAVEKPAAQCLFVDDSDRNVRGARVSGLAAYRWNGLSDLPYLRSALSLPS